MKYMKPEIETIELDVIDVIRTSGEGETPVEPEGPTPGKDETPYG